MKRKEPQFILPGPEFPVKCLALMHRYLFPVFIAVFASACTHTKSDYVLCLGIGSLLFAAYTLAGYLLRWKHIYCSYQNASHQKMTPNRIDWSTIKKSDAYGIPAIFFALGALIIVTVLLP